MAPEVIKFAKYSRFSDIWSLGCTIVEMATGFPPFSKFKNYATAMFHIAQSRECPQLPESLSEDGKDFLIQCFHYEPRDRLNVFQLMRHRWMKNMEEPYAKTVTSPVLMKMSASNNSNKSEKGLFGINPSEIKIAVKKRKMDVDV